MSDSSALRMSRVYHRMTSTNAVALRASLTEWMPEGVYMSALHNGVVGCHMRSRRCQPKVVGDGDWRGAEGCRHVKTMDRKGEGVTHPEI